MAREDRHVSIDWDRNYPEIDASTVRIEVKIEDYARIEMAVDSASIEEDAMDLRDVIIATEERIAMEEMDVDRDSVSIEETITVEMIEAMSY